MFFSYYQTDGEDRGRRLLIDGMGRAVLNRTMGDVGVPAPGSRYEGALARNKLDELLGLIRNDRLWEPAEYRDYVMPTAPRMEIMLVWPDGWFKRRFRIAGVESEPGPASLRKLIGRLMETVVEQPRSPALRNTSG